MINKLLLVLFILVFQQFAQANSDTLSQEQRFEQIYFETAVNVAGRDSKRALVIADSLFNKGVSPLQKVKALMLTATILQQNGEINEAIINAIEADKIATKNNLVDWQARISGFLSTRYRDLGLYKQGEVYLAKGREFSEKMPEAATKRIYLGMVSQEAAYYELEYENFEKALKNINEASNYFEDIPAGVNKSYFTATNEELLGRVYVGIREPSKALMHFQNATRLLKEIGQDDAMFTGLINNGIGSSYMGLNQPDSAIVYLLKANEKAESSKYLNLQMEVYKSLSAYYKSVEDYENYAIFNDKYLATSKEVERKKKEFLNLFVNDIETRGASLAMNQNILTVTLIILLIIIIGGTYYYQRNKKKNYLRFKKMIAAMRDLREKEQTQEVEVVLLVNSEVDNAEKKKLQISESVEIKILEDLNEFEKGENFTDKNMSLSVLSALLATNTKYLSYVLNTHKGKDFNTYINELRVKYIVLKMEQDSKYRSYKISYLAEESGFSSHSKFSAVFKTVTGFTPSVFLDFLAKEQA